MPQYTIEHAPARAHLPFNHIPLEKRPGRRMDKYARGKKGARINTARNPRNM